MRLATPACAGRKRPIPLPAALAYGAVALLLPVRGRIAATWALNFVFNGVADAAKVLAFLAGRALLRGATFVTYYGVLGPVALAARLLGADELGTRPVEEGRSFFVPKEPEDEGEERFLRQY